MVGGCKKDDNDSAQKITATIDGNSNTYNKSVTAVRTVYADMITILVSGVSKNGENFQVSVTARDIQPGRYTSRIEPNEVSPDMASLSFTANKLRFANYDGEVIVNITAITKTTITGTFTGDVIEFTGQTVNANNKKSVTAGAFSATFKK